MINQKPIMDCSLGELMIYQIALTIDDGILAFHGFGSPLVQLALHLAKKTHAPNLVLVAGATYGVNPSPPFLTPTSNDLAMSLDAEFTLDIEELFDLAASGRMGRMFLSGLQIDQWGNINVTRLGSETLKLKLPGGGGGCNLSCDAERLTIWTAAHRSPLNKKGKRQYRLVNQCDFITSLGHRTTDGRSRSEMGFTGQGPDRIITELGVFDFDDSGLARLLATYPDTDVTQIKANTEFDFPVHHPLEKTLVPTPGIVNIIRNLDPLGVHRKEFRQEDIQRRFNLHIPHVNR